MNKKRKFEKTKKIKVYSAASEKKEKREAHFDVQMLEEHVCQMGYKTEWEK